MARILRLWGKKRGARRTGSKLVGTVGEAVFFGVLFLLGAVSLTALVTSQVLNPNPEVLQPGLGFWLMLLVLTSFILIGGGGVIYTVLQVGTSAERRSALAQRASRLELLADPLRAGQEYPGVPRDTNLTNSPGIRLAFRLPVVQSPVWRLAAATAFCLVWNGIASILVVVAINSHLAGQPEWFLSVFMLPFLGIGVWAMADFGRQMLLHTGIGPTSVEISDHPLYPGQRYALYVSQAGRLTLNWLEVLLVCEEQATYHQGTDICSDTKAVVEQPVFRQQRFKIEPGGAFEHQCEFQVPADGMHSFQSAHNAVRWKLVVRGKAESWPPFERSFPVIVFPGLASRRSA